MFEAKTEAPEFRLTTLQRMAQGGKWRVEAMRSYSRPLLLWFTRGQGRVTVAGVTRGYGPHTAVFVPPGTMHGFDMLGQVQGHAVFFPRGVDLGLPPEPMHLRLKDATSQSELTALIDAMDREMHRGAPGMDRALYHHAGLISVWIERQARHLDETAPVTRQPASRRLAEAFTALVERDLSASQGVADYARRLGVTPTHLSRACNETCGRPASKILQDRMIYEARRLLTDTRMPVKDIASSLGFTSAAYFTRAFQHHTGQSPSAFRAKR